MRHLHAIPCIALASMLAIALPAGDAGATAQTRFYYANATSYCQTALPVFDGQVRKRPLAVQNEGNAAAFVTCSFTAQSTGLDSVALFASNEGATTATLSCTGVTGVQDSGSQYVSKTVTIAAAAATGLLWVAEDFGSAQVIPGGGYFSVSCSLPPGIGLNDSYVRFQEEVGA